MKHKIIRWLPVLCALLLLSGCGGGRTTSPDPTPDPTAPPAQSEPNGEQPSPTAVIVEQMPPLAMYQAPPFADAVFHADTPTVDGVQIDVSSVAEGYVAVAATSSMRLKFQVIKDDVTYTYNIENDGKPSIFPLQSGDGHYMFRVMENVVDTKYAQKALVETDVTMLDNFQPYLRPSDYVNYTASSRCVLVAQDLAKDCATELDVVAAVFDLVCSSVTYDNVKATTVEKDYLPYPDETLASGKGICFDYASLVAAMLRSQGIPTKMIFGYVSPGDVYHAWNMFYTDQTGWVTVDYQVSKDSWNRLDLTFSANGADETFIGDGGNYTDVLMY